MPKVILISGGSDGLGKAIAKKLVPNNQVVILAHNRTKLEAAAKELGCDFVEAELTDYHSLETAINQVVEKYHQIDVLVNNAGVWMEGELDENDPQKIKELIDVNTTGTIFLTKAVLPHLKEKKSGLILNIISQDGLCAKKNRSVYHASKWALTGFTKCLQEDLSDLGIKVTGVYPGLLDTGLFQKNGVARDLQNSLEPNELASLVEFVINLSPKTFIPEVGIKNILNHSKTMDDPNSPTIDLNLDPDLITQGASPKVVPSSIVKTNPSSTITPTIPGTIDITPGSPTADQIPYPSTNHVDEAKTPEPKAVDITPSISPEPALSHLSDLSPEPEPAPAEPTADTPLEETPVVVTPAPVEPSPAFSVTTTVEQTPSPVTASPIQVVSPQEEISPTPSSPLAEDPDLVSLIK